jgi:radical SAM protein with 4Fe4S-binding SPASM domain
VYGKLLKNLTGFRLTNYLRARVGYWCSNVTGNVHLNAKPISASIEPANYCNLSCPHCPTGRKLIEKTDKRLTLNDFKQYIDSLLPELMYLNLYFQGEPLLNKDLPEMIRYASDRGVFTCVSTNGTALTEDIVKRLKESGVGRFIICLDGATAESYSKYRIGGDFNKVINGISLSVKYGLPVEVQCLLLSTTENEIEDIKSLCKSLGVKRLVFKKAQFYEDFLVPQNPKFLRYKRDASGKLVTKGKLKNRCWRLFSTIVIDVEGNVPACCFDKSGKYSFGNLKDASLKKVWLGDKAMRFRGAILRNRKGIDICNNCI